MQTPKATMMGRTLLLGAALVIVYGLVGIAGLSFASYQENSSLIWPPTGVALATLLLFGTRLWPAVFLGALSLTVWTGTSWQIGLVMATGNTLEAVVGAGLLRRWDFHAALDRQRDVVRFLIVGVGLSTLVSATIGVGALTVGGEVEPGGFFPVWLIWWLGDAGGALVVAPVILTWTHRHGRRARRPPETVVLIAGLLAAVVLSFGGLLDDLLGPLTPVFLPFPFVIWAAVRFGSRGAAVASFVAACGAVLGTAAGNGPFASESPNLGMLSLWLLNTSTATAALLLGAGRLERLRASAALEGEQERLGVALRVGNITAWELDVATRTVLESAGSKRAESQRLQQPDGQPRLTLAEWNGQVHPGEQESHLAGIESLIGGQADVFECEHRILVDDQYRWMFEQSRVVRRRADGERETIVGIRVDIHERRMRELRREQERNEMEHQQRLEGLGLLAGGTAHDFNNLLQIITLNTDLLQRRLSSDSTATRSLDRIVDAAERAATLCEQMLDYAGKGSLQAHPAELGELARKISSLVSVSLPKNATLELDLAPNLPSVLLDSRRFQQVLLNLVINAGDALRDEGGAVTISTGLMAKGDPRLTAHPQLDSSTDWVFVEVSDDGVGMDEATSARIFEPFFTTKTDGRGLGLVATRGIVQAHHGIIFVDSAPGQGTTCTVLLPAVAESGATTADTDGAPSPDHVLAGLTVLAADDEAVVLELVVECLEGAGATVEAFSDGVSALEVFVANPARFDRVILDQTMPVLTGLEVCAKMRVHAPHIPVVLMSGYLDPGAPRDRNTTFLAKPFTIDELVTSMV